MVVVWRLRDRLRHRYVNGYTDRVTLTMCVFGFAEDPFQGTLRLSVLCDSIRRDVLGDESIRISAFRLAPTEEEIEEDDTVEGVNGDDGTRRSKTFTINWTPRGLKTPTGI